MEDKQDQAILSGIPPTRGWSNGQGNSVDWATLPQEQINPRHRLCNNIFVKNDEHRYEKLPRSHCHHSECKFSHSYKRLEPPTDYESTARVHAESLKQLGVRNTWYNVLDWGSDHERQPRFQLQLSEMLTTKFTRWVLKKLKEGQLHDLSAYLQTHPPVICKFYLFTGKCPFWSNCTFIHPELETVRRQFKGVYCACGQGGRPCKFQKCPYAHKASQFEPPQEMKTSFYSPAEGEDLVVVTADAKDGRTQPIRIPKKYIANTAGPTQTSLTLCQVGTCDDANCKYVHLISTITKDPAYCALLENIGNIANLTILSVRPPSSSRSVWGTQPHTVSSPPLSMEGHHLADYPSLASSSTSNPTILCSDTTRDMAKSLPSIGEATSALDVSCTALLPSTNSSLGATEAKDAKNENSPATPYQVLTPFSSEQRPPVIEDEPDEAPSLSPDARIKELLLLTPIPRKDVCFQSQSKMAERKSDHAKDIAWIQERRSARVCNSSRRWQHMFDAWVESGEFMFEENNPYVYHPHMKLSTKGATATVYFGLSRFDGMEVAIKKIRKVGTEHETEDIKRTFEREVRSLMSYGFLPGIVNYYASWERTNPTADFEVEYELFLVEELGEGTLADALDMWSLRPGFVGSVDHWLIMQYVIGSILSTLRVLHSQPDRQLLHRDLKPDNIIIDTAQQLRFVDFGLASEFTEKLKDWMTVSSISPGTILFASPEALEGSRAHRTSDLYSVGMILRAILQPGKQWVIRSEIDYKTELPVEWAEHRKFACERFLTSVTDKTANQRGMYHIARKTAPYSCHDLLLSYPLFWSARKSNSFLIAVGDALDSAQLHLDSLRNAIQAAIPNGENWWLHLPRHIREIAKAAGKEPEPKNQVNPFKLVRWIRNRHVHARESTTPPELTAWVLEKPNFLILFPKLVVNIYEALALFLPKKIFQQRHLALWEFFVSSLDVELALRHTSMEADDEWK